MEQLGDVFGRAAGEQLRAGLRAHLADALHRQLGLALDQQREHGQRSVSSSVAEDLGEVGRMLLLEQIQQVRGRADAQQALDRVEDDITAARR